MKFDLDAYLDRIGLSRGALPEDRAELLSLVHYRHITHIPFENVDVFCGKGVDTAPEAVFDKLVTRRRGGYCFEMNCLLEQGLRALGFNVYGVLARVHSGAGTGWTGYTHRMNIAQADGRRYVCDVGFGGDCFVLPLIFEAGTEQTAGRHVYRIVRGEQTEWSVQILRGSSFEDMLGFDDRRAMDDDFAICSFYTSSHPSSVFRHMLMINLFTENGRRSLNGNTLTVREGDDVRHITPGPGETDAALREYFGLSVSV